MSRVVHPYHAADISALAKAIGRELGALSEKPGHVELLNILSRSAGYRNFQHFRASKSAQARLIGTRCGRWPCGFPRCRGCQPLF
jgi:hypothetical protein